MLIQRIDGETPQLGRPADRLLSDVSTLPAQGSVPNPQDNKPSEFTDDTLAKNWDYLSGGRGGEGGGGPPATRNPVISEGGHSFSSSSSASRRGGDEQGHVYQRVRARDNSVQINGDLLTTLPLFRAPNNYYGDVTASGKSCQINGNLDLEPFLELVKIR